jgi:hypothetical protein
MSGTKNIKGLEWVTTNPSPFVKKYGYDQGQRGWRLHLVNPKDGNYAKALCGLTPSHGWGVDWYIESECKNCVKKAKRMGLI